MEQLASTPSNSVPKQPATAKARRIPRKKEDYQRLLGRLSRQSVKKHFDAYADVDWDAHAIDPTSPEWEYEGHPLADTDWYRQQPVEVRARLGLEYVTAMMKVGVAFENILARGLLGFASSLPNGSSEFRYAMHEVIEEGQHSLMFQEFVNRSACDPKGLQGWMRYTAQAVPSLGQLFPELFFLFVLGGEAPIDFEQKRFLKNAQNPPPLLKRITQIHVTEEARHICFAKRYVEERFASLPWHKKAVMKVVVPFMLRVMADMMLNPGDVARRYDIPDDVLDQAFRKNADYRRRVRASLAPVRELCERVGIVDKQTVLLWKALGVDGDSTQELTPAVA